MNATAAASIGALVAYAATGSVLATAQATLTLTMAGSAVGASDLTAQATVAQGAALVALGQALFGASATGVLRTALAGRADATVFLAMIALAGLWRPSGATSAEWRAQRGDGAAAPP
jgi:hypothetical protein